MKTETRLITIEQEIFIADDGREFDSYTECEEHEMFMKEKSIEFYNSNLKKCDFDSCVYANLDTPEKVQTFRELCGWNGVTRDGLNEPGIYAYLETRKERWVNLSSVISVITKED